ncbi:unnamed protein product [Rotaria sordida]|uniref:Uncharacterized protein n=1 Tax=Rotaria sordida TaxID=392033 RepID=A0A819QG87_9BILA|nr:unnamed protein product [Rotaria sordida]
MNAACGDVCSLSSSLCSASCTTCDEQQVAGADTPVSRRYDMGATSGVFRFDYNTYTVQDDILSVSPSSIDVYVSVTTSTTTTTTTTTTSATTTTTTRTTRTTTSATTATSATTTTTTRTTTTTTTATTTTTTRMPVNLWNPTINISVARTHHTSTYIPETNTVLLTGGTDLAWTESVHVSTASSTVQGSMTEIRAYHTANRLSTNFVLLAGGYSVATADIFDPIAGSVTGTISMSVARSQHVSATIQYRGVTKVLLAGGVGPVATGDVYDNTTNKFSPVSNSMSSARWGHTATTVSNGYVIIAGGRNGSADGTETNSLDLYNSSSNTFLPIAANMNTARYQHTATYMPSINAIIFAGGWSLINGFLQTYEIFDVATLTFIRNGTMLRPREWFASSLLLNGRVLLIGGNNNYMNLVACEIYDPSTNTVTAAANMNYARRYHTATLMTSTGQVMACGGEGAIRASTTCEVYTP